jgi:LacI family transcriptional regulator
MTATIHDVANRAGVSAITVSRALNNTGYVNIRTRQRIMDAVMELNYVPNVLARSLRSQRTQLLALLITDITNPFWTTVARGVEDAAIEAGYAIILCNTDEDPAKEARYLDLLLRRRVDGLIISPSVESAGLLDNLQQRAVPFVLIDRQVTGLVADSVRGDSYSGAYQLTNHLLKTGYRQIAMIGGPVTVSTAEDRMRGYLAALQDAHITPNPRLIRRGAYHAAAGRAAMADLLAAEPCPAAVFAGNNAIALGVMEALHAANLRVPDDVALVSFDDFPSPLGGRPFLTAVVQPARQLGREALRLLLERLAGTDRAPEDLVFPTQLIIRRSCGCNPDDPSPEPSFNSRIPLIPS